MAQRCNHNTTVWQHEAIIYNQYFIEHGNPIPGDRGWTGEPTLTGRIVVGCDDCGRTFIFLSRNEPDWPAWAKAQYQKIDASISSLEKYKVVDPC